ncbi:hypothetical protein [Paraburkholderia sp. CI3]|uniref:hypothetical protein n=1 Tax=Paraburkholderia sp. CI3 TaxID=2991060 RepID=UPI003D1D4920
MKKNTWIAIVICIALTLLAIDGSTGWRWADYRPLRNFDYFGLGISWLLFIFVLIRDKIRGEA